MQRNPTKSAVGSTQPTKYKVGRIEPTPIFKMFHISPAAGLKNGQFDLKRNFKIANVEYRIMNIKCRIKEFFLFYLLKRAERSLRLVGVVTPMPRRATSTIRQSSIVIRHSMKFHTSAATGLKSGQSDQKRNIGVHRGDRRERREK